MLTDEDIKKLKAVFATKDDLANFATKDDLANFATKDDLKALATKNDFKVLDQKIDTVEKRLTKEIKAVEKRLTKEIKATETSIYLAIGDLIAEQIVPEHLALEKRVAAIEQIPVIAHSIKK